MYSVVFVGPAGATPTKMSAEDLTLDCKRHFKDKGTRQKVEGVDELVLLFNYNLKNFQHIYDNNVLIDIEVRPLLDRLSFHSTASVSKSLTFLINVQQCEKEREAESESGSSEPSLFEDNIFAVIEDELPTDYVLLEEDWWHPDSDDRDHRII